MTIEEAADYWKNRLTAGMPIQRVSVRKMLAFAGAERRGWMIMQRIADVLDSRGLRTEPNFRTAWIDGLVRINLIDAESITGEDGAELTDLLDETFSSLDPSFAPEDQISGGMAPVAETLNIPDALGGVVEIPSTPAVKESPEVVAADAVRRVRNIASANRGVVSVNLQDKLTTATTIMMYEQYSQLAIMQGERTVKGVISWESIAKRFLQNPSPAFVSDCRIDAQVIEAEAPLFEALPTIEKYGYILVRHAGKITGLVTASDVASELQALSFAFISIGSIEGMIRTKVHPVLVSSDLENLEQHSRAKVEGGISQLTFGENIVMLQRQSIWERLELTLDQAEFIKRLIEVRDIRNDVMHFNPDPLGQKQKRTLEQMEHFLRQVFV